jgi:hypothetical protein
MRTLFALGFAVAVISIGIVTGSSGSSAAGTPVSQNRGGSKTRAIQGVWQATEVRTTDPSARTIQILPNMTFFAATHYSRISTERRRPMLADPATATADELRATWGPFVGETGTYEITGNLITLRPIVAKNPAAEGNPIVYSYKFEDDALQVTSVSDRNGAVPFPETIKLIRIE